MKVLTGSSTVSIHRRVWLYVASAALVFMGGTIYIYFSHERAKSVSAADCLRIATAEGFRIRAQSALNAGNYSAVEKLAQQGMQSMKGGWMVPHVIDDSGSAMVHALYLKNMGRVPEAALGMYSVFKGRLEIYRHAHTCPSL